MRAFSVQNGHTLCAFISSLIYIIFGLLSTVSFPKKKKRSSSYICPVEMQPSAVHTVKFNRDVLFLFIIVFFKKKSKHRDKR